MSARPGPRAAAAAILACLFWALGVTGAGAEPTRLAVQRISAAGGDAEAPQLAIDPAGDTVAVWSRYDGTHLIVQAARRPSGGAWSAPASLSAPGRDAREAQVAVDDAGFAVAIWSRNNGSRTVIQASFSSPAGGWSAPVDLSDPEWSAEAPQVAVGPTGEAVAVWSRYDGTHDRIQAATGSPGGAWSAPADLSAVGRNATEPQVAVDAGGGAVALWARHDGSAFIAQSATRPAGGVWGDAEDLSATGHSAEGPRLAVDPGGDTVAVWSRSDGTDERVQSAARQSGGAWSAPVELSPAGTNGADPEVALAPDGEAVAVWSRSGLGPNSIIQAATGRIGAPWSPAVDVSANGEAVESPQVAIDGAGEAFAAWSSSDGAPSLIQSATRPPGGAWSGPQRESELGSNSGEPQAALDTAGDGALLWTREIGVDSVVEAIGLDGTGPQLRSLSIPAVATMGLPVAFSVAPFDVWSAIASVRWSFAGQGEALGPSASHAFPRPGAYQVTVTVADGVGRMTEASGAVRVYAKARAARNLRVRGRRARLRVRCPSPAGCEGRPRLIAPVEVRHGARLVRRRRRIGRTRFAIPGRGAITVVVKLTRPGLRAVRAAPRSGLKAQLTGPGIKHRVVALHTRRRR